MEDSYGDKKGMEQSREKVIIKLNNVQKNSMRGGEKCERKGLIEDK